MLIIDAPTKELGWCGRGGFDGGSGRRGSRGYNWALAWFALDLLDSLLSHFITVFRIELGKLSNGSLLRR